MKAIEWLRKLNPWRARLAPAAKTRSDNMRCSCCRHNIHKGERFFIEQARHRDCLDPKLIGQGRLFEPVPREVNGEQINIAPAPSMGTELL